MMELKAGAKLGRYELLTHIAKGGMADVWLARASGPVGFQKTLVVKTILPHLADDPEFVRMFIDEAVIAAQLDHPNIVHIFDLGEIDGFYFIAMEYIAGRSLRVVQRELHKSKRVPPPWFVLRSVSSACEALHHAHNQRDANGKPLNLVHRDVSPENIMVSFTGETKVLDFGIAKVSSAPSKTRVGVVKGKYAYMAPEQIETVVDGSPLDARIDIYSLGVVMYELLTGRRPFRGANDLALLRQILSVDPEPPSSFCNWIPEPLSDLILKAMARAPSKRFATAAQLQQAIEEFLASQGFHPTHLHVGAFMRSVFGEEAAEPLPVRPPSSSLPDGESAVPVQPVSSEGKEDSFAIDVSILLEEEENAADEPHGKGEQSAPAPGRGKPLPAAGRASARPAGSPASTPQAGPPKTPPAQATHNPAKAPPLAAAAVAPRQPRASAAASMPAAPAAAPAKAPSATSSKATRQVVSSSASVGAAPAAPAKPTTIVPAQHHAPEKRPSKQPPRGKAAPGSAPVVPEAASPPATPRGPFSSIVSRAAASTSTTRVAEPNAPSRAAAPLASRAAVSSDASSAARPLASRAAVPSATSHAASAPVASRPATPADSAEHEHAPSSGAQGVAEVVRAPVQGATQPKTSASEASDSSKESSGSIPLLQTKSAAPSADLSRESSTAPVAPQTERSAAKTQVRVEQTKDEQSFEKPAAAPMQDDKDKGSADSSPGAASASQTGKHIWDRLMERAREQRNAGADEEAGHDGEADPPRVDEPSIRQVEAASSEPQSERSASGRMSSVADLQTPAPPSSDVWSSRDRGNRVPQRTEQAEPAAAGQRRAGSGAGREKETEPDAGAKTDSGPKHVWDLLIERARDGRETAQQELEGSSQEPSGVVERDSGEVRPASSPQLTAHAAQEIKLEIRAARARRAFENGLERLREKDLDGALEEWSKAVELEPDNRAYQSNVRMLKKQVASRGK